MGSTFYETPHLDRLAREGMVFTDAYANAPNCAPTRASLLSGQYTPRHGTSEDGATARPIRASISTSGATHVAFPRATTGPTSSPTGAATSFASGAFEKAGAPANTSRTD